MKLIDRYVTSQLIPVFFLGILAFTGLILGAGGVSQIIRLAIDYNADLGPVMLVLLYWLPQVITYTLPMSILFATITTFNRMSSDLEITAIRASGVSFLRLLFPSLVFAYIISLGALYINDQLVPLAKNKSEILLAEIKKSDNIQQMDFFLTENKDGKLSRALFVHKIHGHHLTGVTVQEFEKGMPVRYIIARKGEWKQNNTLILSEIETVIFGRREAGPSERNTFVKTPETLEIPFQHSINRISNAKKKPDQLQIRDLRLLRDELKNQHAENITIRKLSFEIHKRLAIPFASLAFALIAAPLALRPQRASSSVGLGVSLFIILIYYIFQEILRNLGMRYLDPAVAAWLPDGILFAVGLWLCVKARK